MKGMKESSKPMTRLFGTCLFMVTLKYWSRHVCVWDTHTHTHTHTQTQTHTHTHTVCLNRLNWKDKVKWKGSRHWRLFITQLKLILEWLNPPSLYMVKNAKPFGSSSLSNWPWVLVVQWTYWGWIGHHLILHGLILDTLFWFLCPFININFTFNIHICEIP